MSQSTPLSAPAKRARDLRLDFFRGIAMFIILLAHTPGNPWTLWIPARFGFSDATEIFVFCSGMASGIAFGTVFVKRSWHLGAARIIFRVWQVYWAHIGIVLFTAGMLVALQSTGLGPIDKDYTRWFPIGGFFSDTPGRPAETLLGLFTLTYVPGLFDILPMYLVILAMVPLVMGIYRIGGREAVFIVLPTVWLLANLAGYARVSMADVTPEELAASKTALQLFAIWLGDLFSWMNLPGVPWEERATWFFNPFAWQLVFFTGFAFAMGWIPAPPVRRWLIVLAIAVVILTVPFAWHKTYQYLTGFLPEAWGGGFLWDARGVIEPFRWKTWIGGWRFLHFLALAYLAWAAVGPGGIRLSTGWGVVQRTLTTRRLVATAAALAALATVPWTYLWEIKALFPALDAFFFGHLVVDGRYHGLFHLIHLAAMITLIWHSIGDRARHWLVQDAFLACVPVIRKVGTQSLAVFLVSIALSRFNGWWMDSMGVWIEAQGFTYLAPRDVWVVGFVNLIGFGVLIATAYTVSWFKRQPWRQKPDPAAATPRPSTAKAVPAE
ncbi:MAG: OpgC domain-containing protein [Pseudomonadota bacterium]